MSLDIYFQKEVDLGGEEPEIFVAYTSNMTHNVGDMLDGCDLYEPIWYPERNGIKTASQLIPKLRDGIAKMEDDPNKFKVFDAPNGWGTYEQVLPWLREVLRAALMYPKADVYSSR